MATTTTTETVGAATLLVDLDLYPRQQLNTFHIARLANALRAGASFPPVIADRATRKLVDGAHRTRATLQVGGPNAVISVAWRDYADEAALFLDAVAANAAHGLALTQIDLTQTILKAERLGADLGDLQRRMHMTPDRFADLTRRRAITTEGVEVALKPSFAHLAGRQITPEAAAANRHGLGVSPRIQLRQLLRSIQSDAIDWQDEPTVALLRAVHDALTQQLTDHDA